MRSRAITYCTIETMTRATGDPIEYPATLSWLGFARLLMGDLDGARRAFQTGYDAATQTGTPLLRAYLVTKLGLLAESAVTDTRKCAKRAQQTVTGLTRAPVCRYFI